MRFFRRFAIVGLVALASVALPARADVQASASIALADVFATTNGGTVEVADLSGFNLMFVQALDSTGGFSQNSAPIVPLFNQISASTPFAAATDLVDLGIPIFSASASVNLPNQFNGFASSEAQITGSGTFEVTGTAPVSATFMVANPASSPGLGGVSQSLFTNGTGVSASSEAIFTLTIPLLQTAPVLAFDNLLTIGPNQSQSFSSSSALTSLTNTLLLQPNTVYNYNVALDVETSGVSTPEPASIALALTAIGLSVIFARRLRRRA